MTEGELKDLHEKLYLQCGFKINIYYSAKHKAVLVTREEHPLHPATIIFACKEE